MNESRAIPKILIADDNTQNVELLEAYLSDFDCDLRTANDGEETLRVVEEFQPDLLLLDIMMPRLSGFEVCRKIRSNPATKDLLILMVTALNEASDFERGVQAGTDDFLTKPVNKIELLVPDPQPAAGSPPREPARAHAGLPCRVRGRQPGIRLDRKCVGLPPSIERDDSSGPAEKKGGRVRYPHRTG